MINISYKKASEKTTVEIQADFVEELLKRYQDKVTSEFVPPLFDEFVIVINNPNGGYELVQESLFDTEHFLKMTPSEQDDIVKSAMKEYKIPRHTSETIYVKYISATEWALIYFEPLKHRKVINVNCEFLSDSDSEYAMTINHISNEFENKEEAVRCFVTIMLCVSYYMQHYCPQIEYKEIDIKPLEKTENSKGNKGYSQAITLKSKIKKYVLSSDTTEEAESRARKYRKLKSCWIVRGHYQRYGKQKIIKYIAPYVCRRQNMNNKLTTQTYKIEGDKDE